MHSANDRGYRRVVTDMELAYQVDLYVDQYIIYQPLFSMVQDTDCPPWHEVGRDTMLAPRERLHLSLESSKVNTMI